jgi:O-antigen ligase
MAGLAGVVVLAFALIGLDMSPEIVLAILAAGIAIPFLVLRPHIGVHLFIVTIYVENMVYADRSVTAIKLVGVLILVGWLLSVAVNRRVNLKVGPVIVMMLGFLAWNAVAIVYAFDADLAVTRVLSFIQLGVAMCMVGSVIDSTERVRGVFRVIVLWTTLASVHGMALYFLGLQETSAGVVLNRNAMATYVDIAIVCAYLLYQMSPSAGERVWLLIALPTLFLGLALTFSRTGYITLVVVFLLVSYRLAKTRGYLVLGATAAMLIMISAFLPEAFYKRVESIIPSMRHQEETFGIRVDLWKAGVKMIRDHPMVGVGPGNYSKVLPRYGQGMLLTRHELAAHNSYVGIAAEAGIPALALYLLLCAAAIREARLEARALKRGSEVLGLQAVAVEICLVVMLIAGLSSNFEKQKYLYVFFGIALSLGRLARQSHVRGELPVAPPDPIMEEQAGFDAATAGGRE